MCTLINMYTYKYKASSSFQRDMYKNINHSSFYIQVYKQVV